MLSSSLGHLLSQLFQRPAGGKTRRRRPRTASYRPRLRTFEERVVPSVTTWIGGSLDGAEQWTGGDPTAWSNALNWTNGVPGAGDTAVFTDNISETYVVNGQNVTHNGPQSFGPTVDQAFSVVGVTMDSSWTGTLEAFAPLSLTGSSSWAGGSVAIDLLSSITNTGTFNISAPAGGLVLSGVGTFVNSGTINELAGGDLLMGASVVLNNTSSGVYDFQADVNISHPSGFGNLFSEIINAGTFEKTAGTATSTIGVALANSNAFTVQTGTLLLAIGSNLVNPVNTGGVFAVSQGATLDLTGGSNPFFTGNYTGSGAGTVLLSSGTLSTGIGGATFNLPGNLFQWTGGTLSANLGNFINTGTMNIVANNQLLLGLASLVNQGTINESGSNFLIFDGGATLSNAAGAVYNFTSDSSVEQNHVSGQMNNAGTVEKTGGTGTSAISVVFDNSANLTVQSGTLSLAAAGGSLETGGVFTVSTGATLDLTGGGGGASWVGTYTGAGGGTVLLGSGTLNTGLGGATFNLPGNLFQWSGGTLSANLGNFTNTGTMTIVANNQFLVGLASLVNQGTIKESGSNFLIFDGGATLTNAAGGVYLFTSDGGVEQNHVSGQMNNAGTVEKTGGTGTSVVSVAFNNSTGIIVQTGTLALEAAGGSLETGGLFTVAAGATLDLTGGRAVTYIGSYTGSGGGTVQFASGELDTGLTGATFNFPGSMFQWTGGTLRLDLGTFTNTGTMNITGNGQSLEGGQALTNKKLIDQTGGPIFTGSTARVVNNAGATYKFDGDSSLEPDHTGGFLTNAGILEKSKGTGTSHLQLALNNTGTVEALTGTLSVEGSVAQLSNGTLTRGTWTASGTAAVPATLTITSGSFNTLGSKTKATLSGVGASFSNLSSLSNVQSGATLSLLKGAALTLNGGLTVGGSLIVSPASILTVQGSFTELSTGILTIQFGGTTSAPTFGQVVSTSGTVSLAGNLVVTSTVAPAVGSSFEILDNGGGSAINGVFANLSGTTFTVKKGTTVMTFQITYSGADGDDSDNVLITRVS